MGPGTKLRHSGLCGKCLYLLNHLLAFIWDFLVLACILLATHMAYCILISCWVDLPVTHICIICRLVIMLFIPFLYRTFHPDIFLLVRLIMEELDNTADWCWGTVCLVSVISQGSLFCCFNVTSKIAVHVLKLKDFLQLFSSASSFLFPHVDLSLLFLFFFFLPLSC